MSNANVTLTVAQAAFYLITVTGVLSTNVTLIFPGIGGQRLVVNNTTGAFAVTLSNGGTTTVIAPRSLLTNINLTAAGNVYNVLTQPGAVSSIGTIGISGSAPGNTTAVWTVTGLPYFGSSLALNFNGSGTGAGGMDTGALLASNDVSIYLIYNPTAASPWNVLGTLGSVSNGSTYTGSNMPSGYTLSALLCSIITDSGGNIISFIQKDRKIWTVYISIVTSFQNPSYINIGSLVGRIPANAKTWFPIVTATTNAIGNLFLSSTSAGTVGVFVAHTDGNKTQTNMVEVPLLTYIAYAKVDAAQWSITSTGYTF